MSFRRLPFQFSSTDPLERQAELEKRFGLPSENNMYVDVANPLSSMGATKTSGSPRLQHRVPIFLEGFDQPLKTSVDSVSSTPGAEKKSNVRVIPIEIEDTDLRPPARRRNFSGPAGMVKAKENSLPRGDKFPQLKRFAQDFTQPTKVKLASGPNIHNIPIQIEGRNAQSPAKQDRVITPKIKKDHLNGCGSSKLLNKLKCVEKVAKPDPVTEQEVESPIEASLRKIEEVLKGLVSYEAGVKEFNGTVRDKQYRYLDEMLTRCMLRLDDIDTMGNSDIRSARKNAIKKVQQSVDLLEAKVNATVLSAEKGSDVEASQPVDIEMNELEKPKTDEIVASSEQITEVSDASRTSSDFKDSEINASKVNETGDTKDNAPKEMAESIPTVEKDNVVCTDNSQNLNTGMEETDVIQTDSNIEMKENTIDIMGDSDGGSARGNTVNKVEEASVNHEVVFAENCSGMQADNQPVDVEMNESKELSNKNVSCSEQIVVPKASKFCAIIDIQNNSSEADEMVDTKDIAEEEMIESNSIGIKDDGVLTVNNQDLDIDLKETDYAIQSDNNIEISEVEMAENTCDKLVDAVQLQKSPETDTCTSNVLQTKVDDVDMEDDIEEQVCEPNFDLNPSQKQIEVPKICTKTDISTNELVTDPSVLNTL